MNKTTKYFIRSLLILLIAVWAVHFIYPVYYSVAIKNIKAQQKQVIAKAKLRAKYIRLTISEAEFKAACKQGAQELSFGNEMYELISFEKKGNKVGCIVLHDVKESTLNKTFSSGIEKEKSGSSSGQIVFWAPAACEEIPSFQFHNAFENNIIHFCKLQTQEIHSGYLSRTAEPPELA